MFFRREKPRVPTFQNHLDELKKLGFSITPESGGGQRAGKGGIYAVLKEKQGGGVEFGKPGVLIGNEIGVLADAGYQKFWLTPSGKRGPATADQVKALQNFVEDLREGLGMISLYNESLGSTNEVHLYDRVKDRDFGVPKRPWER